MYCVAVAALLMSMSACEGSEKNTSKEVDKIVKKVEKTTEDVGEK